ncbi:MAG: hypothetical protein A2W61_05950 [Deltaproteobacteria bacterium RIFCSPLOWO2_01_44_7]|nr:MAG: hypothetical protein A2712_06895 [Deltaproteobacteria bacterium RIFCSPHIGHO2_01_FULL_43_49]OGQ15675.1 MAG: hypothetical protein A3D22_05685 [Deltaproteobacteria bacterium RIFCSPHIGHO2_02_FULL_44_53]OGQ28644.1 MAG: hypothetical protein A3D98_00420 [Deltaproteobacteria bacterium RIFCSPHIGHO2_12_FULL_44_21]OGQ31966.1 MAG: hypothetical protein A2979_02625 [Deltaproteobacteria bacterium RIFCSPLOWO2_01_FULL_45_74]OGQ42309.1 MAG: hypothetical protein A2W61_05950 [Deltaproteobacteria bacterium 
MTYRNKQKRLIEFKKIYLEYLTLSSEDYPSGSEDKQRISELRSTINKAVPVIIRHVNDVGGSTSIYSANIGGLSGEFNLFANIFHNAFDHQRVLDLLDRAIGRYDYIIENQWKKWINPLYWIGELIRIPFYLLRFAGFDATKVEMSIFGKLYKVIVSFVALFGGLIKIYEFSKSYLAMRGIVLP